MTTPSRRFGRHRPAFVILSTTQQWRLRDGVWYRDCVIRFRDGATQLRAVRDDLVSAA